MINVIDSHYNILYPSKYTLGVHTVRRIRKNCVFKDSQEKSGNFVET